jgi:hypothetical protein
MIITRHNYEEYFILYMDNELGGEDRGRVELFVQENPDLKDELDWLLQSRLVPDASLVFDNKEQLMKTSGNSSINTTNYEKWLLLYTDNELTAEQKIAVEKFAATHPAIQKELELLQKTKFQPEQEIIFHNKELLYRKEEKVRVVAINWRKIAVAAAILLAISTTTFIVFNNKGDGTKEELAANKQSGIKSPSAKPADQPTAATINANPVAAKNSDNKMKNEVAITNKPVATADKKAIAPKEKNTRISIIPIKEEAPVVAGNNTREDNPIAQIDLPVRKSLTNPNENIESPIVTPPGSQSLNNGLAFEPVDPTDAEQSGKKNKFRGFFRKVTRTFEKTTNIKATDDEDRLLLGGLAIKL